MKVILSQNKKYRLQSMSIKLKELVNKVVDLSKEVGNYIVNERKSYDPAKTEEKSFNNLVSYVDKTAEEFIVKKLREILPEAGYITEEGTAFSTGEKFKWIIDPLDGTTNYIHGISPHSVSFALISESDILDLNLVLFFFVLIPFSQ